MKFLITTLGCKVNQHESDVLAAALSARGWRPITAGERAEVCVVNTCTVTQRASMQSRQLIRQLQRAHPGARVVVTGCYAQIAPHEIAAVGGVHAIVGRDRKAHLPEIIVNAMQNPESGIDPSPVSEAAWEPWAAMPPAAPGTRTRPFLKIQDGCNSFCTYCIVPYARGRSRSLPPERVMEQLARLGAMGYREVVLTGIHLGAYGLDLTPPSPLMTLMEAIEAEQPVDRVRLSSIEPNELTEAMIELVASSDVFCPHFHLPLQSGADAILKRMHRPYTRDLFRRQVEAIHGRLPRAAIGADVLVGFPGEAQANFAHTARLLDELPLSYLHVFPFSARPGTPAAGYPDQIAPAVIKERTAAIRAIGAEKKAAFMAQAVGRRAKVLVETRRDTKTRLLKGLTGNYLVVLIEGDDRHMNTILPVQLEAVHDAGCLMGKIAVPEPMNTDKSVSARAAGGVG